MAGTAAILLAVASSSVIILYQGSGLAPSSTASQSSTGITASSQNSLSETTTLSSNPAVSSTPSYQITVVTLRLLAGTATGATAQGTASLQVVLHNPGAATTISSIDIVRPPNLAQPRVYQCSSATACSLIASPTVIGYSNTNFTSPTAEFSVGAALSPNLMYGYYLNFGNGLVVFGTVNATAGL
jgi:hypothetical protein